MGFDGKWAKKDGPSQYKKIREVVSPPDALKSRLIESVKRIEVENLRLDNAFSRFQAREKELFNKAIGAMNAHDAPSANIYANEIAEIRKIKKIVLNTKVALEQIATRVRTSVDLGDVAVTLIPAIKAIDELKSGIGSVSPQAQKQIGDLGELLNGIVVDVGSVNTEPIGFESVGDEVSRILVEAQAVAESRLSDTYPTLPGGMSRQRLGGENSRADA